MVELFAPLGEHELIHLGCGEGYYCRALAERLPGWQFAGFDIAKNAIFAANRRSLRAQFVIADPARPAATRQGPGVCWSTTSRSRQSSWSTGWRRAATFRSMCSWVPPPVAIARQPEPGEHGTPPSWPSLAGLTLVARQRSQFSTALDQGLREHILETSRLGWRASGEQRLPSPIRGLTRSSRICC